MQVRHRVSRVACRVLQTHRISAIVVVSWFVEVCLAHDRQHMRTSAVWNRALIQQLKPLTIG